MSLASLERLTLGSPIPQFSLSEPLTGRMLGPADFPQARAILVAFLANACPFVSHIRDELTVLAGDYADEGLQILAINPNVGAGEAVEAADQVQSQALAARFLFPYLADETQATTRAFGATCTPDFFLFGHERTLFYHGQFDGSRPGGAAPVSGGDLRHALDVALAGLPPPELQLPSAGSPIRWFDEAA